MFTSFCRYKLQVIVHKLYLQNTMLHFYLCCCWLPRQQADSTRSRSEILHSLSQICSGPEPHKVSCRRASWCSSTESEYWQDLTKIDSRKEIRWGNMNKKQLLNTEWKLFVAYIPGLVIDPVAYFTLHTAWMTLVPVEPQVTVGSKLDSQVGWWI